MIRLLIFALVRFIFVALVIYVVLSLVKVIIRAFTLNSRKSPQYPEQDISPAVKEDYKDVKDAKFIELPKKEKDEKQD